MCARLLTGCLAVRMPAGLSTGMEGLKATSSVGLAEAGEAGVKNANAETPISMSTAKPNPDHRSRVLLCDVPFREAAA